MQLLQHCLYKKKTQVMYLGNESGVEIFRLPDGKSLRLMPEEAEKEISPIDNSDATTQSSK